MPLSFARGSVQWLTSQTVGTTIVVTGLGFQPKALRFTWTGIQSNSPTNAFSTALDMRSGVGFATGTADRRCVGIFADDNVATENAASIARNDSVVVTIDGAAATTGLLDLSAIGTDGFTLIVDDVTPANITVNWEAWGGTDITVQVVGDISEPAATGTQNYTVTGFAADGVDQVVMFAGCQSTAALNTGTNNDGAVMVGFATSTSGANQVVGVGNTDDGASPTDTSSYARSGECLAMQVIGDGNPNARANLSAWGTNQFTLNWTARASTGRKYIYMAIKGGKWRAGVYTINGGTIGNTATVSGLPFQPEGISAFTIDLPESAAGTVSNDAIFTFGSAKSTTDRGSISGIIDHNQDPSVIALAVEYDRFLVPLNPTAIKAEYDINAINTDGFQVIVDVAGGNTAAAQFYLAAGNELVSPTPTPTITPTTTLTRTPTLTPTPTVTPTQGGGAAEITFIGVTESTGTSITLPTGLLEGDFVIIQSASDGTTQTVPATYTLGQSTAGGSPSSQWVYKFMGPTPDTTVTGLAGTSIHIAYVFRNVDTTTPLDVTPPTLATGGAGMPNSSSITTITPGCAIISMGFLDDDVVAAAVTPPSTYTLIDAAQYGTAGAGATIMAAYIIQTSAGPEDPGAFAATGGDDAWVAATVALRPLGGIQVTPTVTPTRTLTPTITPTITPTTSFTPTLTPTPTITPTVSETPGICKIEQVGTPTESTTTSITLPTGLQENDLVIIVSASDGTAQTVPSTFTLGQQDTNTAPVSMWSYKFMGATPDTTATGLAGTSIHMAFAFRNVDTTTPFDVASPTMSVGGTLMPNSPSITTVTARSMIVSIGFLDDDVVAASVTPPAGFTLIDAAQYGSAGAGATVMAAQVLQNTAGAIDPGSFGSTGGDDAWVAATIALRFSCNTPSGTPTQTPTRTLTPTPTPSPIPGGVVTDGLVLYLDPGNPTSYAGTGTLWNDLSLQNNDGTLVNSPTYLPYSYSGTFLFDGVTQYVDEGAPASLNTGLASYQVWVRNKTPSDALNHQIISRTNTNVGTFNLLKRSTNVWGVNLRTAATPASQSLLDSVTAPTTSWTNLCVTYDGTTIRLYINGVQDNTTSVSGLIDTATLSAINIMRNTNNTAYFNGQLGVVLIYNKALSGAEITQNYNAFSLRYPFRGPQFQSIGHPFII